MMTLKMLMMMVMMMTMMMVTMMMMMILLMDGSGSWASYLPIMMKQVSLAHHQYTNVSYINTPMHCTAIQQYTKALYNNTPMYYAPIH